jgi:hypothetical protein
MLTKYIFEFLSFKRAAFEWNGKFFRAFWSLKIGIAALFANERSLFGRNSKLEQMIHENLNK